ncbi:hypothetical protein B0H14DRAFT_3534590 [Mycena olivaceomarginata]|nr:hypothetical protein B0H14DRAFT_3534590 [Mycena olivaceomarginata]
MYRAHVDWISVYPYALATSFLDALTDLFIKNALDVYAANVAQFFAAWSSTVDFFAPLLSQAVGCRCEGQEDHELEDEKVDEDWMPDPLNQVDEEWPLPIVNTVNDVPAAPSRKRHISPTFEQVVASSPAQSGSHRHRARKVENQGHDARPAAIRKYVAHPHKARINQLTVTGGCHRA